MHCWQVFENQLQYSQWIKVPEEWLLTFQLHASVIQPHVQQGLHGVVMKEEMAILWIDSLGVLIMRV